MRVPSSGYDMSGCGRFSWKSLFVDTAKFSERRRRCVSRKTRETSWRSAASIRDARSRFADRRPHGDPDEISSAIGFRLFQQNFPCIPSVVERPIRSMWRVGISGPCGLAVKRVQPAGGDRPRTFARELPLCPFDLDFLLGNARGAHGLFGRWQSGQRRERRGLFWSSRWGWRDRYGLSWVWRGLDSRPLLVAEACVGDWACRRLTPYKARTRPART